MILSILVIVVLATVAFFHYTQGLFNATVSAVCAAVAAFAAFGYHEPLVRLVGPENLGSYGDGVTLVALYGGVYLLLRAVLDNFLPSNVRYPVIFDKIGAGVMGLVAGFFSGGIVAVSAQMLPFGASVMMHAPYPLETLEIPINQRLATSLYRVPRGGDTDVPMENVVLAPRVGGEGSDEGRRTLWAPLDTMLVDLVTRVGNHGTGSLAGSADFAHAYPGGGAGYVDTLFARRIGFEGAAKRTAINHGERVDVRLGDRGAAFNLNIASDGQFPDGLPQVAGDDWFRARGQPDRTYRPAAGTRPVVMRVFFDNRSGEGNYVRFGPANARLVVNGTQTFANATLESQTLVVAQAPDDRLLTRDGVDLIFEVPTSALRGDAFPEGAFIEFKEHARIPLGGVRIHNYITADARTQVARKETTRRRIHAVLAGGDPTAVGEEAAAKFEELRAALPAEPVDAEEAETAFLEARSPEPGRRVPPRPQRGDATPATGGDAEPADDDAEAGTAGFIGRNIAPGAGDRNRDIEGE